MRAPALLRAAHLGPTVAVTAIAGLLAVSAGLPSGVAVLVVAAVLTGQLVIGWSNDLLDLPRDLQVGRTDKPLASGEVTVRTVHVALAVAGGLCVLLSLGLGWAAGAAHLVLVVGSGLAYNLGLKSTAWSWLPYAVAFGTLPAVVTLAGSPPALPPWWLAAAGALLGVGAHVVNVLPDLAEDAATGVRGLPHRLGAPAAQLVATAVLLLASATVVLGPAGAPGATGWLALALSGGLALAALVGSGKTPFRAAVGIALVNVALLALASGK
jgi:4-hydroxybenzoate polyprenyltransferase